MQRTKQPQNTEQKKDVAPQKVSRSVCDRPQTTDELVGAIDRGSLDGRTGHVRRLLAMREALSQNPETVTTGLLRDVLAVNSLVASSIIREVCKPDFKVLDEKGALNPVLARHWPETQRNLINAAQTLLRLEQATPYPKVKTNSTDKATADANTIVDVSSIVLQLQNTNQEKE